MFLLAACDLFATFPILDTIELSLRAEQLLSYFPYLGICIELEGSTAGINRALAFSLSVLYPFLLHLSSLLLSIPLSILLPFFALFSCFFFSYILPPTISTLLSIPTSLSLSWCSTTFTTFTFLFLLPWYPRPDLYFSAFLLSALILIRPDPAAFCFFYSSITPLLRSVYTPFCP